MENWKYEGFATTNINTDNPISLGVVRGNTLKEIEEVARELWLNSFNMLANWNEEPKKTIQIRVEDRCWNIRIKFPYSTK